MIEKEPLSDGWVRVSFRLSSAIWADRIALVGSFNGWDRERDFFDRSGPDGDWRMSLELSAGHRYQFRYLVDGEQWLNDDQADAYEPNPYGGFNAVIQT